MHTLRNYQTDAVTNAVDFLSGATGTAQRRLYSAPTGTGKSLIELEILRLLRLAGSRPFIVTPRVEIIGGMLDKLGRAYTDATLAGIGQSLGILTPIRLRNMLLAGEILPPTHLIIDESHHHNADTYQQLDLLSQCPAVGFTATPFRGTARGTQAFRAAWGEPVSVLTWRAALDGGYLSFPSCIVLPLVDDDVIEVANGEFQVRSVSEAVQSRLGAIAEYCTRFYTTYWDRPTMLSLPDTESARACLDAFSSQGLQCSLVTQETSAALRRQAFANCVERGTALIQINVVSEGVDLPIRRLIDLSPMISPVRWLQQLGRITRPVREGESPPEYICTNRNLLRHAYLLQGLIPPNVVASAQKDFGGIGKRPAVRVVGLENLGRLKAVELPLIDGTAGIVYSLSAVEGSEVREYAVLVHPLRADPIWATRTRVRATEGTAATYGRWAACEPPGDLSGFASVPPSPLTDKMAAWWARSAGRHGLDPKAKVNRKNFVALPVLADLKRRL